MRKSSSRKRKTKHKPISKAKHTHTHTTHSYHQSCINSLKIHKIKVKISEDKGTALALSVVMNYYLGFELGLWAPNLTLIPYPHP